MDYKKISRTIRIMFAAMIVLMVAIVIVENIKVMILHILIKSKKTILECIIKLLKFSSPLTPPHRAVRQWAVQFISFISS